MTRARAQRSLAKGLEAASGRAPDGPRIGLVLGGGGARGLAHIAVCEALDEMGLKPAEIVGTSIGAIIGAAYASGMSGAAMRDFVVGAFRDRAEVVSRIWRMRSARLTDLLAPTLGNPAQLNAEQFLGVFLPESVPESFEALPVPFTAVASDFYGWHAVGLRTGSIRRAVAASMAIPVMFRPVIVDGRVMVDGGVTDPLPIGFLETAVDLVVAVDVVNGPRGNPRQVPGPYEAIFGATQILMQAVVAEKIARRPPDILVRPNISIFRVLDFLKARAILRAAQPAKAELKRSLEQALTRQPDHVRPRR